MIWLDAASLSTEKVRVTMKFVNTFALWPIAPFGGEDDDEDISGAGNGDTQRNSASNSNGEGGQGNSGQGQNGGKGGKSTNSDAADDDDDVDEYKGLSIAEVRRIAKENADKLAEAETQRKAAQDKVDAEERKKRTDIENLTNDKTALEEENRTLRASLNKQAIESAIRDDDRYEWHDIEMVAGLLDSDIVKVSDAGKVDGLKAQLPRIAKEHPFLVKGTKGSEQQQNGPTGLQPGQGSGSGSGDGDVNAKALAENYPALAGRI